LEGPSICSKGGNNALSIITISDKGDILKVPDLYMEKIAVGPELKGTIDINLSPSQNLKAIAEALEVRIEDLTVVILDRPRHRELIKEIRDAGARIKLIGDGDVSAGISTANKESGINILMGIGGAREGIVTASALKCMGGDMQGKLVIKNSEDMEIARKFGINDFNKVYNLDELVKGETIFVATGVTDGDFLKGVRFFKNGAYTHSVIMTSKNIRYINSTHYFDRNIQY
jgi:fructose-1,6-bisphosphatase II